MVREYAKFCTPEGELTPDPFGRETRTGLAQIVRRAQNKAKIGDVRPHDIGRHSFGRRLTAGGMDRRRLKKGGQFFSLVKIAGVNIADRR